MYKRQGQYRIELFCGETTPEALLETVKGQLEKKELIIEKRSKKGVKLFDLKPAVQKAELFLDESGVVLETILPAGSTLNVNPSLLVEAFCLYTKLPVEARNMCIRDRCRGQEAEFQTSPRPPPLPNARLWIL